MSYQAIKHIDFCYGHRLLDYEGKCKHLHGHNARIEIIIAASSLDARGMVIDFSDIKHIAKTWIDENLDHCMLLRADDPILPSLKDAGERYFVMKENPTAENIARLICEHLIAEGLSPAELRLWETPDSVAVYRPDAAT